MSSILSWILPSTLHPAHIPAPRLRDRDRGGACGDDSGRGKGGDKVRDDDGLADERHLRRIKEAFITAVTETPTVAELVIANANMCPFHSNATHSFLQCYTMKKVATNLGVHDNLSAACRECNVTHDGGRGNRNSEILRAAAADNSNSNNTSNTTSAYSNPLHTDIDITPVPPPIYPAPQTPTSIRRISDQETSHHHISVTLHNPTTLQIRNPTALQIACTIPLPITTMEVENYINWHTKCWAIACLVTLGSTAIPGTTAVADSGSKWNISGNKDHFLPLYPLESDQPFGDDNTTIKIEGWCIQDVFLNGHRVQQVANSMLREFQHHSSLSHNIFSTKDTASSHQIIKRI